MNTKEHLLLDTNCLLILLVGLLDQDYLHRFTKTKERKFIDTFEVLLGYYGMRNIVFLTNSYLLCELSHQTIEHKNFEEKYKKPLTELLSMLINQNKLIVNEANSLAILENKSVFYMGFADISCVLYQSQITLLTFDTDLFYESYKYPFIHQQHFPLGS